MVAVGAELLLPQKADSTPIIPSLEQLTIGASPPQQECEKCDSCDRDLSEDLEARLLDDEVSSCFHQDGPYSQFGPCRHLPLHSCIKTIPTILILTSIVCSMYIFRDYIRAVLMWIEHEPPWEVVLLFTGLFTLVSLPLAWGYIVLNLAAGYLFGLIYGLIVTVISVTIGIVVAHLIVKMFLESYVKKKINSWEHLRAIVSVINGPNSFKIIAMARLTPVPFGLQNALFSVSSVSTSKYVISSVIGLLPTQAINAYIGSRLRSMEEVLTSEDTIKSGWILLAVQILFSIVVGAYIVRKARAELNSILPANSVSSANAWMEAGQPDCPVDLDEKT